MAPGPLTVVGVLRAYGDVVRPGLPVRSRAMLTSLTRCRTPALGGHLAVCGACGHRELRYHGCRDRHCPTCAAGRTVRWLADRERLLLPVPCFQVVFTVPAQLRPLARLLPRLVYGAVMSVSARVLQDALKTRYDARFAITSVLHTWTRELDLHPHVHHMVSAGGLARDDASWVETGTKWLVATQKLEPLFRARMLASLRKGARGRRARALGPRAGRGVAPGCGREALGHPRHPPRRPRATDLPAIPRPVRLPGRDGRPPAAPLGR